MHIVEEAKDMHVQVFFLLCGDYVSSWKPGYVFQKYPQSDPMHPGYRILRHVREDPKHKEDMLSWGLFHSLARLFGA